MKKLALIQSTILIPLLVIGCSNSIAGTYIGESDSSTSLRLDIDGTFTAGQISGRYDVQANELSLLPINPFAEVAVFKIEGKRLISVKKYLYFIQSYIKK